MYCLVYFVEGILPYLGILVFILGTLYRIRQWLKIPVPLRINLAPSKATWKGVTGKIAAEVLIFIENIKSVIVIVTKVRFIF